MNVAYMTGILPIKKYGTQEVNSAESGRETRLGGSALNMLACCLCSENDTCQGCNSGECPDKDWCENRKCSLQNDYGHCFDCKQDCRKGLLSKIKPYGFTLFVKRFGEKTLMDCLERNEKSGVVYHREGITGDYDDFEDVEKLIDFIWTGTR